MYSHSSWLPQWVLHPRFGHPTGRIEDLKVPRDREGAFHSQVFERYKRYEPEVAEALTQMDVTRSAYPSCGRGDSNLAGSCTQCERRQSSQSDPDRAI
ncbi:MAG TPA: transposase [Ktedonobacteraceae bacterium]